MKQILIIILILLTIFGVYLVVDFYDLSLWIGLAILLAIFAVALLLLSVKKYYFRKKEQKFVKRVISEYDKVIDSDEESLKHSVEEQFLKGIKVLNSSDFSTISKNPVYALPWYLFFGEEDSGKTTFLKNSNITTSITDVKDNIKGKKLSWWFFNDCVALDIPGKFYNLKHDLIQASDWEHILELIIKHRPKEPINGLVVTISVESLLTKTPEELMENATFIRKQINHLMRLVGANFPTYIMVTKFDQLFGSDEFLSSIAKKFEGSSFGYLNDELEILTNDSFAKLIDNIIDKLKQNVETIVKSSVVDEKDEKVNFYQFINEFEVLTNNLRTYLVNIFEKNKYQEIPKFRGVYFSSSAQDGSKISSYKDKYSSKLVQSTPQARSKSFFAKDFISKILPEDRFLFSYLKEFIGWSRSVKSYVVITLSAVIFSLSILSYFSYSSNNSILEKAKEFKDVRFSQTELSLNISQMYNNYIVIKLVEKEIENSWLSSFPFSSSNDALEHMIEYFMFNFDNYLLDIFDAEFAKTLKNKQIYFEDNLNYDAVMSYLLHNLNTNYLLSKNEEIVFEKSYKNLMVKILKLMKIDSADLAYKYSTMFENYFTWTQNPAKINNRNYLLKEQFANMVDISDGNLFWLTAQDATNLDTITLENFWATIDKNLLKNSYIIPGAFTQKGKEKIKYYLDFLRNDALKDRVDIDRTITQFWSWYYSAYEQVWFDYLKYFSASSISSINVKHNSGAKILLDMISSQNPFNKVVKLATKELKALNGQSDKKWLKDISLINELITLSKVNFDSSKTSKAIVSSIKKMAAEATSKISKEASVKLMDSTVLADYYKKLYSLSSLNMDFSRDLKTLFSQDKTSSALSQTYEMFNKFRFNMEEKVENKFVLDLISGPIDFVIHYATSKQSCALNNIWAKKVLYKTEDMKKSVKLIKMFDEYDGYVSKFINSSIDNYVTIKNNKYDTKYVYGIHYIPFGDEFFRFINHGYKVIKQKQKSYKVTLETSPIEVNVLSTKRPYSTSVSVSCDKGMINIENMNYFNSEEFVWSNDTCGDTVLKVSFKDFELLKKYEGGLGFAEFLNDIKSGKKIFTQKDFSLDSGLMKKNSIDWVDIGFKAKGPIEKIANLLNPIPYNTPKDIASCK